MAHVKNVKKVFTVQTAITTVHQVAKVKAVIKQQARV
jgi:hypothetical protein